MEPLEPLLAAGGSEPLDLPGALARLYGGPFALAPRGVFANFVSSLDGVVRLPGVPGGNRLISGASEADRFVMGLLRACADVVLVGSGTLRGSPKGKWSPEAAFPDGGEAFAELRTRLHLRPAPGLAFVTSGPGLPVDHPVLEAGALVLTTAAGASLLAGRLPEAVEVVAVTAAERVDLPAALDELRARGHGRILVEAGPQVMGSLLGPGLVDELFLTLSPLVAGRAGDDGRFSFAEGVELLPDLRRSARLADVRRHGSHLFLRYAFDPAGEAS